MSSIRGESRYQPIKCPHLAWWLYMLPAYSPLMELLPNSLVWIYNAYLVSAHLLVLFFSWFMSVTVKDTHTQNVNLPFYTIYYHSWCFADFAKLLTNTFTICNLCCHIVYDVFDFVKTTHPDPERTNFQEESTYSHYRQ